MIPNNYDYLQHSFLSSVSNAITDAPRKLLQEHYRCHPKIIEFCNKKFYDGNLIIMTEDKGEKNVLEAYISAKGNHARGHKNIRQIDIIEEEIVPNLTEEINIRDIGVISPYREQKKELETRFGTELKVDTVHKFQGREEQAIILTTVDNEIGEFVDDPKMLNVAVTRAKRFLRVVVSDNENNVGTNIDDLIKYIQYNNFEIIESKTKSIYDMLYKENRKQRMEYLKNKNRISDYDSENLTYNLIEEVIKENNFDNFDIVVHIPLIDVLANQDLLNEEEKLYTNNDWTHIDFVIFNKMYKKMILAVEVDGYYYHKEGTKQQERDKLKDKILEKYDVPFDIDGYIISIDTGKIDSDYMNTKFEKYLRELNQENISEEELEKALNELHRSYSSLSQTEQKYAQIFIHDIQSGGVSIEKGRTFREYITEYMHNAEIDQIRKVAEIFGLDEEKLRNIINLKVNENNINAFGRFDELLKSVDMEKAKNYLEKISNRELSMFDVNIEIGELLRKFILSNEFDIDDYKLNI